MMRNAIGAGGRLAVVLSFVGVLAGGLPKAGADRADYPLTPVPFMAVRLADSFWLPRIETNRTVTIPFLFRMNEETGRLDNFRIAAGFIKGDYRGERYNDTDVYKALEGAAYSLMVRPDPALEREIDGLVATIAAAQEPDGYLFTPRTASPGKLQPGIGPERWSELAVSHELYNAGHMIEAAVAHFQATGKRAFLDVAIKNADLLVSTFGPGGRAGFPGHQEVELALAKLYRATGDKRYLALAGEFLDRRGRGPALTQYPPGNRFAIYNEPEQIQAHRPVLEQAEAVGHAVRVSYMLTGMADIAALAGRADYLAAVQRLWDDVVGRKMYLTGGIGARHDRERFGEAYELPNLTGYAETCASIGMAFWNHRMFLLTGEARYLDVLERVMYNGVLAGIARGGAHFFYPNPLESDGRYRFNKGRAERAPWFGTACCPGNIARFLPSIPGYVYATRQETLYVNLFVAGSAEIELGGRKVAVRQETRYPWDGTVRIVLEPERAGEFAVAVRVPGWALNRPVPTDLYRQLGEAGAAVVLKVNGREASLDMASGFARIRRVWKKGDAVEIVLPMVPCRVVANEAVKADAGMVALERGPLVFCAEAPDNGGRALDLVLPDDAALGSEFRRDLLGGLVVVTADARIGDAPALGVEHRGVAPDAAPPTLRWSGPGAPSAQAWDDEDGPPPASGPRPFPSGELRPHRLVAIPYYAWAHRGPGEMAVWLHRKQ